MFRASAAQNQDLNLINQTYEVERTKVSPIWKLNIFRLEVTRLVATTQKGFCI